MKSRFPVSMICVLLASLLTLWSCQGQQPNTEPELISERPNIILISLDACRADHLSCYGYARTTSPFVDQLAADGIRFSEAIVNTHGTPPSHTTMLTSLYQESHGMHLMGVPKSGKTQRVTPAILMVQEILRASGYLTLGVTGGGHMSKALGFDRGFVEYDSRPGQIREQKHRLLAMLKRYETIEMPRFILFHTYEIHSPYNAPKHFNDLFDKGASSFETTTENLAKYVHGAWKLPPQDIARITAMYDAEIRFSDTVLKELFTTLSERRLLDNAVVIITADHGEEFGEHGGLLHGGNLYEELIKVPMIIWQSGTTIGHIEDRPVSTIDITPTILGAAGLKIPETMRGRDLLTIETWPAEEEPAAFVQYGRARYGIRTTRWKLIENQDPLKRELYDLINDPGEKTNLVDKEAEIAQRLLTRLSVWRNSLPVNVGQRSEVVMTGEEQKNLKALGYLQ